MSLASFFRVLKSSGCDSWGNVFLTSDWTLHIDFTKDQHDLAMQRLGIDWQSVLVSAAIYKPDGVSNRSSHGISFRSSPGEDRREISNEEARQFMAAIKCLLKSMGELQ